MWISRKRFKELEEKYKRLEQIQDTQNNYLNRIERIERIMKNARDGKVNYVRKNRSCVSLNDYALDELYYIYLDNLEYEISVPFLQKIYDVKRTKNKDVIIDELGYSASDIAFFSNDEIVIDMEKYKDCINKQKILEMAVNVRFNIPFRIELFYLHKITGTDGYYKEIVRNIIEREYEFKCLNNYTLPFVLRKFNREEITENDKVFYHEGLLSKFMEVPNMEVKLNENKYSV